MKRELGLMEGFFLCLRDSRAIRVQSSRWKRSLLLFSSGVCLEIAAVPLIAALLGRGLAVEISLLSALFAILGFIGL